MQSMYLRIVWHLHYRRRCQYSNPCSISRFRSKNGSLCRREYGGKIRLHFPAYLRVGGGAPQWGHYHLGRKVREDVTGYDLVKSLFSLREVEERSFVFSLSFVQKINYAYHFTIPNEQRVNLVPFNL